VSAPLPIKEQHFRAVDGTRLVAWSTNGDPERTILICHGLGGPPNAWRPLIERGHRIVSWHHRGLLGSDRPKNPRNITVADHVSDAERVLELFDVDSALVVGWSLGVAVGLELARTRPERVNGVIAIAGAPGGIFDSAFAPVPFGLGPVTARLTAEAFAHASIVPNTLLHNFPSARLMAYGMRRVGVIDKRASNTAVADVWREFAQHDWGWYARLGIAGGKHPVPDLSTIEVPVVFVAGERDVITAPWASVNAAAVIEDSEIDVFDATHFLPLEYPENVVALIEEHLDKGNKKN